MIDSANTRRHFLAQCGLLAGAAAVMSPRSANSADAPARNGKCHMKLSLAAYSFNKFLPNRARAEQANAKMTLEEFIQFCADQNLDGTELTSYYFPKEFSNAYLMKLKELTFRLGLDISGTAIGNDFCKPAGEAWEQQIALTREWIDHAATMGAPVIRIFAGSVPRGDTEAAAFERCVAAINKSLEYAAEKGVFLALENHGGITGTAEQLLKIVKAVSPSPWFGVNLDGGNFHSDDPYAELEQIAPYAVNAQVKVAIIRGESKKKEPADLGRVIDILRKANYRGYVVLEYEESDPFGEIPKVLAELRKLIHA
jgi:sugar phosphate isomerase/epimerase